MLIKCTKKIRVEFNFICQGPTKLGKFTPSHHHRWRASLTHLGLIELDFGGWDMPLHYGSQLEEHHVVRRDAGMFDVSHMTVVDVEGGDAMSFLQTLLEERL